MRRTAHYDRGRKPHPAAIQVSPALVGSIYFAVTDSDSISERQYETFSWRAFRPGCHLLLLACATVDLIPKVRISAISPFGDTCPEPPKLQLMAPMRTLSEGLISAVAATSAISSRFVLGLGKVGQKLATGTRLICRQSSLTLFVLLVSALI